MNTFLTAIAFLTRIPVPAGRLSGGPLTFSRSIVFFPVTGGIIGVINGGLYWILKPLLPIEVLAVLLITLPIFISGGIHFDGLLDTCDGVFSGRSRERSLEIMRDSRIGSMGVIAGIIDVMLRYSMLITLPEGILPVLLITQPVTGRWVMSLGVQFFPYARQDGGLGQGFNEDKRLVYTVWSTGLAWLIIFALTDFRGVGMAVLAGILSLGAALWVARRLGGLTGDVYGGLNEIAEVAFMMIWLCAISLGLRL
ncbi:MAG: adenosylcobinamide-GDP ribazoletransferase [Syntrophomonas sp.]|nr:adenosylcobinamide-GDP ribazoletransferase [Syntrophomonas sp.]